MLNCTYISFILFMFIEDLARGGKTIYVDDMAKGPQGFGYSKDDPQLEK